MSTLRPTLRDADPATPIMVNGTAYLMILQSISDTDGLIHGRLINGSDGHCAIGHYFRVNCHTALQPRLIDEVAAVNDSVPNLTPRQRKFYVMRWLRWRLTQLGMCGFRARGKAHDLQLKGANG